MAAYHDRSLDFDRAIALADRSITPRFVVANVKSWNFSETAVMHVHDPAEQGRASTASLEVRPSTSHGILNRPKRQSFSRPLTSDGPRRTEDIPPPPRVPAAYASRHESFDVPGPIGVAITSPLMPPADIFSSDNQAPPPPPSKTSTSSSSIKAGKGHQEQPPAKPNRWKTMGSLFRRKAQPPPTPAPLPARPETPKKTKQSPESSDSSRSSTSRRRSLSRRLSFGSISRSKVKLEDTPPIPKIEIERARSRAGSTHPGSSSNESNIAAPASVGSDLPSTVPMLNIEIPQVKMDRYSIMFSDLLSKSNLDLPLETTHKNNNLELLRPRTADPAPPALAPVLPSLDTNTDEYSLLHERRKIKMEKLSPLNMHRISSSPKFHQAPFDLKTAPLTRPLDSLPPLSAPPPPPKSAPLDRSPSVRSLYQNYSLFPKTTDSSPQIPEIASFSPDINLFEDDEPEHEAASVQDSHDSSSLRALPPSARPLRSSSLLQSETETPINLHVKRASAQPVLFPPSPPISSKDSPSTGTLPTTASASFRSSRYSRGSSMASSDILNLEHDFPSGIEINVENADHLDDYNGNDDYDEYRLVSPTFYEKSDASAEDVSAAAEDGQDPLSRSPSTSSAIGDSPLLGMNRNVSLSYKHERPRFLRSFSDKRDGSDEDGEVRQSKDGLSEGRASARTPTFVHVDDFGRFEDEDAWIRRRSMWGVMDDGE